MISSLKNKDGLIYAYIEWQVVNAKGQYEDNGSHVYIADIWVQENHRNRGIMKRLLGKIKKHKFANGAYEMYWVRKKYNDRLSIYKLDRLYSRIEVIKRSDKDEYLKVAI